MIWMPAAVDENLNAAGIIALQPIGLGLINELAHGKIKNGICQKGVPIYE